MWQDIEARIEKNEREDHVPLRSVLWQALRSSALRPGEGVTKKMVSFEFGQGERRPCQSKPA